MKIIERFYQYLDYKGIKPTRFEKENNLSNGYLGTQLKRNGSLGEDAITTIIDNCRDLDITWLLTGKGSMLNLESENLQFHTPELKEANRQRMYQSQESVKDEIIKILKDNVRHLETSNKLLEEKVKRLENDLKNNNIEAH